MIKLIIGVLKYTNKETENIRIATGKYKLATTWSEAFKQIKEGIK
jgi:hypothetical protein|tara:strand:- start:657 stop:791 length:135 start_codon:yes stop_codon:yes gene_type:complete